MSKERQIEALNELLKGEYMARDIYDQIKGLQGDEQVQQMLGQFQEDHDRHIQQLKARIVELGGQPFKGPGWAGTMAKVMAMYNSLRGPEQVLKQVYQGEEMGVHSYEDRLDGLDEGSQGLVKQIMDEDHEHLKFFEARMDHEEQEEE
jgi:rubrerythrin